MAKFADHMEKIERGVVGGYKKIEDGVVGAYKKVEDTFVSTFMAKEGETAQEAKAQHTPPHSGTGGTAARISLINKTSIL